MWLTNASLLILLGIKVSDILFYVLRHSELCLIYLCSSDYVKLSMNFNKYYISYKFIRSACNFACKGAVSDWYL